MKNKACVSKTWLPGPESGHKRLRAVCCILTALYSLFMLYLLLIRNRGGHSVSPAVWRQEQLNLVPFHSVAEYLAVLREETDSAKLRNAVMNLGGNIFLFVPFGFLLPLLCPKLRSFSRTLLLMAVAVAAVEVVQLLTCRGHCDVDDLILNLVGVSLGFLLFLRAPFRSRFQET